MVQDIAYTLFLGKPLIMYGGMLSFFLMMFTAVVGFMNFHGNHKIPFKWHPRLALTTIIVVVVHAVMGLSVYLNF
jgi:hypothetical protein